MGAAQCISDAIEYILEDDIFCSQTSNFFVVKHSLHLLRLYCGHDGFFACLKLLRAPIQYEDDILPV